MMKIKKEIQKAMEQMEIAKLRKGQIEPINTILKRRDVFVVAPTSSGKSAMYQIPALIQTSSGQWTLVIEPTLALIEDQVQKLKSVGIAAESITSRNAHDRRRIIDKVCAGRITILYITPEQLWNSEFIGESRKHAPWLVVIDEAHCVLEWGYTFRKDYLKICKYISVLPRRPVIAAFTATAPMEYREQIIELLNMEKPTMFVSSLIRKNIRIIVEDLSREKMIGHIDETTRRQLHRRLRRLKIYIKRYQGNGKTIVYCATKKNVDFVSNALKEAYPGEIAKCHSDMHQEKRIAEEVKFISGKKSVMVATTAFGMGIDVPDVRLVIHFDLPISPIDYYQQIGRAGRDGEPSWAVLLYDSSGVELNRKIIHQEEYPKKLRRWLDDNLMLMVSIAEEEGCYMKALLSVLDEIAEKDCGHCSNCQRRS